MNKFNILWVDNDWKENNNFLQHKILQDAKDAIEAQNSNISITVRDSIAEGFATFFASNDHLFNLVIVDLMFEGDNHETKLIIEHAQLKFLPVVIFSSYIGNYDLGPSELRLKKLILGEFNKDKSQEFIECVLNLSKFRPISFVHISDFHYDSSLRGAYANEQNIRFEKLKESLVKQHKACPFDLILFTGDFAARNQKDDFDGCFAIIQDIVNATVGDFSRLCVIPGNHDIEWDDFDAGKISATPCKSFYRFIERIYNRDGEIIANLIGFNSKSGTFDEHFDPDSFCWFKRFRDINLEILGLNSVTSLPEIKGLGKISPKTMAFINNQWNIDPYSDSQPAGGDILRLALFHHNILPPFSINTLDECKMILNAGQVIELFARLNCGLILSGHCHDSYLYNFSYSVLNHHGFSETKKLSYISTGTSGGYSSTLDRARSFNIINIFPSNTPGQKNLIVTPYIYDSKEHKWIGMKALNSIIGE